jgi:lysozyme
VSRIRAAAVATIAALTVLTVAAPSLAATTPRTLPAKLSLSAAGTNFIAQWEGFIATPYNDPGGNCTVGYGHLIHLNNCTPAERARKAITPTQGKALLRKDVNQKFVPGIRQGIPKTPLHQYEFDALVDWAYNVGTGYITGTSSVRSALQAKPPRYTEIPTDLQKYVYSGSTKLCGLYQRRMSESHLWTSGSYAILHPSCPVGYSPGLQANMRATPTAMTTAHVG